MLGALGPLGTGCGGSSKSQAGADSGLVDAGTDVVSDALEPDVAGNGGSPVGAGGAAAGGGSGGNAVGTGGGSAGTGGMTEGGADSGGATGGVSGTSGGAGGAGGLGADAPLPSPGCQLANAHPAEGVYEAAFGLEVRRRFPSTYDGTRPMPLILALHATNSSGGLALSDLTKDQPAADGYVIVAPTEGSRFFQSFEVRQSADFSQMLAEIFNELCIDERRVFGVGNGSGGRALIMWASYLVKYPLNPALPTLRALAVVGTVIASISAAGPLPTIFIHPLNSNNSASVAQDADGTKALAFFRKRNACSESSMPASAASCVSRGLTVDPGCVDFADCGQPLRFCHHNDPIANTSGDPWPCVASPAIFQFFAPYR